MLADTRLGGVVDTPSEAVAWANGQRAEADEMVTYRKTHSNIHAGDAMVNREALHSVLSNVPRIKNIHVNG